MTKSSKRIKLTLAALLVALFIHCASKGPSRVSLDPASQKFLDHVSYIILPIEEKIFREMPSEDRGDFIHSFWARRDPIPSTPENEYRQVYYSRMAISDKAFGKGMPGWKTDRGRIYILLGPPTNIIEKTMGDTPYEQTKFAPANLLETGTLTERPTIIWVYDNYTGYFEGPLRLVFVDHHSTGDFKLTTKENITAFSLVSPDWDPPDLAQYQWVGEIEMDELELGTTSIFDYDAVAKVIKEQGLPAALISIHIPYARLDYQKQEERFACDLTITAEVRDLQKKLLTRQEESHSEDFSRSHLQNNIGNKGWIEKQWTLALPPQAKYIYVIVTDQTSGKTLRKLLEIK